MKNDVDFSRIVVDEKIIGVLNFNSMIPVNNAVITKMNLLITPQDTGTVLLYQQPGSIRTVLHVLYLNFERVYSESAVLHMVTGTLVSASRHKMPVPKCFVLNRYV